MTRSDWPLTSTALTQHRARRKATACCPCWRTVAPPRAARPFRRPSLLKQPVPRERPATRWASVYTRPFSGVKTNQQVHTPCSWALGKHRKDTPSSSLHWTKDNDTWQQQPCRCPRPTTFCTDLGCKSTLKEFNRVFLSRWNGKDMWTRDALYRRLSSEKWPPPEGMSQVASEEASGAAQWRGPAAPDPVRRALGRSQDMTDLSTASQIISSPHWEGSR